MKNADKVNAVALTMQTVMGELDAAYDKLVGRGQHNVVLLVGAGDMVQFAANCPRKHSIVMLQDLLARWSLGMPDTMPGETAPGDTKAFEYLLNTFEQAAQHPEPATQNYGNARAELLKYVGELIAQNNRKAPHV